MALTAKFTADFSQFESAIKGAAVTVTTFEKGVKNAAADLSKLASSLSGAEIQRQATIAANAIESIGGATKLTAAEAAKMAGPIDQAISKYKALGQQVPPELEKVSKELAEVQQNAKKAGDGASGIGAKFKSELAGIGTAVAGAFTLGAVISFGKGLVDLGGQITDTANKLGISTDAVQEFEFAAASTGSSLETFSGAMIKLQDNLANGSKGTLKAISDLNLSFDKLQKMAPDEKFTAVADAIKGIEDPMRQTQIAMELFGKAGVEALPAIREGMSGLRQAAQDSNQVISKEGVQALDDFGDMAAETYKRMQVGAAQMAVGVIKAIGDIDTAFKNMSGGARSKWDQDLDELDRRIQQSQYQMDRLLAQEVIKPPPLPPAPSGFGVGTGQADANKVMEEGAKRANDLADAHIKAGKAAAAHAKEIQGLRDELSGAKLQGAISKLAEAWDGLSKAQKENDAVLKRILPTLETYVREGGKLPPVLQKIYDEHRRAQTAVADLTGGFSKALPILGDYATKLNAPVDALKSLRLDGLLPAIPLMERFGTVLEIAGNKSKDIAGDFKKAADAAAEFKRQGEALAASQWASQTVDAVASALQRGGGLTAVIGEVATVAIGTMRQIAEKQIADAVANGMSAGMAMVANVGVSTMAGLFMFAIEQMMMEAARAEAREEARKLGAALGQEFIDGFGSAEAFEEIAQRAGVGMETIRRIMSTGFTAEDMQVAIAEATPALLAFQQQIEGLGVAAQGVNKFAAALGAQFAPGFAEQKRALEDSHKAILEYEKAGGASAERLAELQKTLAADASKQVFTLTAENIDRVNSLGLFIGATIANTVGRTGDLVGAMREVGPALAGLDAIRDKADLSEQLSPATQQVLSLYDAVSNNEDAFNAISGIGQMMAGFGQAMIANTPLANAFGGELAAQFTILRDRGVDANVALASMQAPLQELWELSREGKITVDETTQALLNQAEAQGIVGADMMDTNEQMLAVLGEIRDLFAESLPAGIAQTARASRDASGVIAGGLGTTKQKADELAAAIGPKIGIAAQTGQLAVLTATDKEKIALQETTAKAGLLALAIGPGMTEAARTANHAIDTIANRRITIPIHFDMDEPPPLPDYPSQTAPSPPTQPGDEGTAQAASAPQSAGHTEVNFNVDGNTLARIVASKLPGVVNGYVVN